MNDGSLTAGLPDATQATFIPIMAVLGALAGSTIARFRHLGRGGVRRWTEDGAYIGAMFGLIIYLVLLAVSV